MWAFRSSLSFGDSSVTVVSTTLAVRRETPARLTAPHTEELPDDHGADAHPSQGLAPLAPFTRGPAPGAACCRWLCSRPRTLGRPHTRDAEHTRMW